MKLSPFGTMREEDFKAALDEATEKLRRALPKKTQKWGLARKLLNPAVSEFVTSR
jgi:ribosome-associated translation inhibitor RaiA